MDSAMFVDDIADHSGEGVCVEGDGVDISHPIQSLFQEGISRHESRLALHLAARRVNCEWDMF